jgi:hypothetical protein
MAAPAARAAHYWRTFYQGRHFGFTYGATANEAAETVRDANPEKRRDDFRVSLQTMQGAPGYVPPRA